MRSQKGGLWKLLGREDGRNTITVNAINDLSLSSQLVNKILVSVTCLMVVHSIIGLWLVTGNSCYLLVGHKLLLRCSPYFVYLIPFLYVACPLITFST